MKHMSFEELQRNATITSVYPSYGDRRALRRARLERLATLLEQHEGTVRLFSRVEYLPASDRALLRVPQSPLTIAFQDPVLRAQGLASDRIGDAMQFFDLSGREVHHLLCDCHSVAPETSEMIAARVRSFANRKSMREIWTSVRSALSL